MTTATAAQLSESARSFVDQGPHKLLIGEDWVESASGETFETLNPATGEVICEVAEAGAEDVDLAVKAAQAAFEGAVERAAGRRPRGADAQARRPDRGERRRAGRSSSRSTTASR